jgi:diguanylate cyclase (GGDEF)-like protein
VLSNQEYPTKPESGDPDLSPVSVGEAGRPKGEKMKYLPPVLVLFISGLFAIFQISAYESLEDISIMSALSEIFLLILLFIGLLIIQRMRSYKRIYGTLTLGFAVLCISLSTDILDEFLVQPGFITSIFEDLFQIIGYALVITGIWLWIINNNELTEKLKLLATTDNLTGAFNRRRFREAIWQEINRAVRYSEALTLIAFDLDHFKKINDTHGHHAGDEALQAVAEIVTKNIRSTDILARTGGEEFALIAPSTDLENARVVAERLRETIEEHSFGAVGTVTVSFGVAELKKDDHINAFISRADRALYNAKERGRNRVEIAE